MLLEFKTTVWYAQRELHLTTLMACHWHCISHETLPGIYHVRCMCFLMLICIENTYTRAGGTKAPFVDFSASKIFDLAKVLVRFLNHILIWQLSPQLSCGGTCQISTWYSIANGCFDNAEKIEKKTERGNWSSNPHPRMQWWPTVWLLLCEHRIAHDHHLRNVVHKILHYFWRS